MSETLTSSSPAQHVRGGNTTGSDLVQAATAGATTSPAASSVSHQSVGGKSETSSQTGSHISKSSTGMATTSTSTSSPSKARSKPPTLDAIAARMKKTSVADKTSQGAAVGGIQDSSEDARLSRLPMPGRLNSTLSDSSDSASLMMPPAPVAHGEPPARSRGRTEGLASLRDKAASRSRSTSPTKPQRPAERPSGSSNPAELAELGKAANAAGAALMGKEMPSLQDIIDRMSKKGIASSSGSINAGGAAKAKMVEDAHDEAAKLRSQVKPAGQAKEGQVTSSTTAASSAAPTRTEEAGNCKAKEDKGHPLQHKWTMYFDSKSWNPSTNLAAGSNAPDTPASPGLVPAGSLLSSSSNANSWEAALKMLGVYTSVESFMSIFSTLRRPSQLERNSNYHLFKDGIKPMWEDAANQNGGKWVITLKGTNSALLDRSWMWLVLALIGEELDESDDVTGAVVSTRSKGDRIALWIRNKTDVDLVNKIGRKFVLLLDLEKEPGVSLEFSPNSMDDGGSRKTSSAPSKFISFNNSPAFASPVFGQQHAQPLQHASQTTHRTHTSPGKSSGVIASHPRMGSRRGSEQLAEHGSVGFPTGLGGPIGRTLSPSPGKSGVQQTSTLGGSGSSSIFGKPKMGLGMSPPM